MSKSSITTFSNSINLSGWAKSNNQIRFHNKMHIPNLELLDNIQNAHWKSFWTAEDLNFEHKTLSSVKNCKE